MYTHTHIHVTTMNGKRDHEFELKQEGIYGEFLRGRCNYTTITKIKEIFFKDWKD